VRVTGIVFFDYERRQTGVAPSVIELHPVLDFASRLASLLPAHSLTLPLADETLCAVRHEWQASLRAEAHAPTVL